MCIAFNGRLGSLRGAKFYTAAVPRIGDIAIFFGILAALFVRYLQNAEVGLFGLLLMMCSLPAFLSVLTEDLTKKSGSRLGC
jgi:hypothetical protein